MIVPWVNKERMQQHPELISQHTKPEPHAVIIMAGRIWHNIFSWLSQRTVVLLSHERPAYLTTDLPIKHLSLD